MTIRRIAWRPWLVWGLSVGLVAGALLLPTRQVWASVPPALWAAANATVGTIILLRRPGHPIGWLLAVSGLSFAGQLLMTRYAAYSLLVRPSWLPGGEIAAWVSSWAGIPGLFSLLYLALLFPHGRLPSRRWRWVAWLGGLAMVAALVSTAFLPGSIDGLEPVQNPLGVEGAEAILLPLGDVAGVVFLGLLAAAAWSLLQRWRRAQGDERSQLKWFAYAAGMLGVSLVLIETMLATSSVGGALIIPGLLGLPIAVGVAVLRYRLYEIDRLINRTLVYGLVTATLGLTYAGMVLVGGQMFGGIGGKPPSWAVAGATLAVAALFQPARRHIQQAVDQRFNRRRYDTAKTVEAFAARLRDQVDLDALSAELLVVVDQTMQPTRVSLWLRPGPSRQGQAP